MIYMKFLSLVKLFDREFLYRVRMFNDDEAIQSSYYIDIYFQRMLIKDSDQQEVKEMSKKEYEETILNICSNKVILETFVQMVHKFDIRIYETEEEKKQEQKHKLVQYKSKIYILDVRNKTFESCEEDAPEITFPRNFQQVCGRPAEYVFQKEPDFEKVHISQTKDKEIRSYLEHLNTKQTIGIPINNLKLYETCNKQIIPDDYLEYNLIKINDKFMLRYDEYKNNSIISTYLVDCETVQRYTTETKNQPPIIKDLKFQMSNSEYKNIRSKLKYLHLTHFKTCLTQKSINDFNTINIETLREK